MDRSKLTKIKRGGLIGNFIGFVRSWNWFVDFVQNLRDGFGIKITFRDHICTIDRDRQAGGENNSQNIGGSTPVPVPEEYHPYLDKTLPFWIEPLGNETYKVHAGTYFLNGWIYYPRLSDITFNDSGWVCLKITRNNGGTGTNVVELVFQGQPENGIDGNFIDNPQIAYYPLYEIVADSENKLSVNRDFLHSMPNLYFWEFNIAYKLDNRPMMADLDFSDGHNLWKTTTKEYNILTANHSTTSEPVTERKIVFTAEDYEV